MVGMDVDSAFNDLPPLCLFLLQGLTEIKQKELADEIKKLRDRPMQDNVKLVNLGLALLNTVGSDVLEKSVAALKEMGPGAGQNLEDDVEEPQSNNSTNEIQEESLSEKG